jgi:hypothetical protein
MPEFWNELDLNGNKIVNLGSATNSQDAVPYAQVVQIVDNAVQGGSSQDYLLLSGGTLTGDLIVQTKITSPGYFIGSQNLDDRYLRADVNDVANGNITFNGSVTVNATGRDFIVSDTNGSLTSFIWRDASENKLLLGTNVAQPEFRHNCLFGDRVRANFGDGNDLAIYHNGTNTYMDNATGVHFIRALNNGGQIRMACRDSAGVMQNSASFTSEGIRVQGHLVWHNGNRTADLANNPLTIVQRDNRGDINTRLFRSEYDITNANIGFIMTQVDTASDNYIRPSTPAQFRAAVTDASYLAKTEKAADSNKLDNLDSLQFLRSDANDVFTGTFLRINDGSTLRVGTGDEWRLQHIAGNNLSQSYANTYFRTESNGDRFIIDGKNTAGTLQALAAFGDGACTLSGGGTEKLRVDSVGTNINGNLTFNNIVGDRISLFGTGATAYALGVEANTFYYRANQIHRWYVGRNADEGANDIFELSNANGAVVNTVNFHINSGSPTIFLNDTTADAHDFRIHVNSDIFYILTNYGSGSTWSSPHPLALNNSSATGTLYGKEVLTQKTTGEYIDFGNNAEFSIGTDTTGAGRLTCEERIKFFSTGINERLLDLDNYNHRFYSLDTPVLDINIDGIIASTTISSSSDPRLKYDVNSLNAGLEYVDQIRFTSFKWKSNNIPSVGVDLDTVPVEISPYLVREREYKSFDYSNFTAVNGRAIQELHQKVKDLESQVVSLNERLTTLENNAA